MRQEEKNNEVDIDEISESWGLVFDSSESWGLVFDSF